ncbi:hypothetical protein [Roseomonas sp. KE2513]|uniref:hypothetical protein n=1 Tax=Roseomonas sp. KE2513 TaxID=2479202 RepID=UPI0018DF53A9|nr:hypothetical protein [Roseomonas sp. KE2513]
MTGRLSTRISRLDGGGAALQHRQIRSQWWAWRGTSPKSWPASALDAFDRSGDADDPKAGEVLRALSDTDLDWLLMKQLVTHRDLLPSDLAALLPDIGCLGR